MAEVYKLSDDERAAVEEGLAQAERGEFVPDAVVDAFFKRRSGSIKSGDL